MQKFKDRWEIKANWQLIFPVLGIIGLLFSSFLISKSILKNVLHTTENNTIYLVLISIITALFTFVLLRITLKLFEKLRTKWNVNYRWELIAIFIAFAVTGSTSAKISDPIIAFIGLAKETTNAWVYWPIRILLIFPVYQILLIIIGWLFGQFEFFWHFEKKMLRRIGFSRFLKD